VHELGTTHDRTGDPDKTKPPTRVEELWGCMPPGSAVAESTPGHRPADPTAALSNDDGLTLYRAARDCMVAGAFTGASALLRRLILQVAVEQGNGTGTREEAERLFGVVEALLELSHEGDRPSNA
jgi:hypothetical protein